MHLPKSLTKFLAVLLSIITPVACAVMIGAGTMVVSHVNDSGWWVSMSMLNMGSGYGQMIKAAIFLLVVFIALGSQRGKLLTR